MSEFTISERAAKKAALAGDVAALKYCVQKYQWIADHVDAYINNQGRVIQTPEIGAMTCALCVRYVAAGPLRYGCPLNKKCTGECCDEWHNVRESLYDGKPLVFRRACLKLAAKIEKHIPRKERG
jgi:hypothetical protein